jgi:hypothetical protein
MSKDIYGAVKLEAVKYLDNGYEVIINGGPCFPNFRSGKRVQRPIIIIYAAGRALVVTRPQHTVDGRRN